MKDEFITIVCKLILHPSFILMSNYSHAIAEILQEAIPYEEALPLRNEHCRSLFFLHPKPTRKVLVFFHGFTAAPWQFEPMGEGFYKAGYNVLVPLMPGHGCAGDWSRGNPPPLPVEAKVYQQFALHWLDRAKQLGEEVYIGGLSGGGTVAAWLALECPEEIAGCLLFGAYLTSSSRVLDLLVRKVTPDYQDWGEPRPNQVRYGYNGFDVQALKTILNMGGDVLKRAKKQPSAPMFIVSSQSDRAVGNRDHRALFEDVLTRSPRSWYHIFDRVLDIPHTMMTKGEGNPHEQLLIAMAKAYVESNLTWANVREIAYCMTLGQTFYEAVDQLALENCVSRDMPIMMTMLDKRSLVAQRNPSFRGW